MFSPAKRSALLSWLLHGGAIVLILATTGVKTPFIPRIRDVLLTPSDIAAYQTHNRPSGGGGGGGGAHSLTAASKGELPRFAPIQIAVPRAEILNSTPILPWEPTLVGNPDVQTAVFDARLYGDPNGVVGPPSDGRGTGGGIGDGEGTGVGPGKGAGHGPGEGDGEGGGVNFLGARGSVTSPTLVTKVDPDYSEEARRARLQGTVLLRIEVNPQGLAENISVRQGLGLGLDQRAIDAVKKWKFKPGTVNGKPAAVVAYVEVNFRLL